MKRKLKKIALATLVTVVVMRGSLAWLTTGETKKGKIKSTNFSVFVESVEVSDISGTGDETTYTVSEVLDADEQGFYYSHESFPVSKTNLSGIEKVIPYKYVRITNDSDLDALVEFGVTNINMANENNELVFTDDYSKDEITRLLSGASFMFWFNSDATNKELNGYELPTYGTRTANEDPSELKEIFINHTDSENTEFVMNDFDKIYNPEGNIINPYTFIVKAHTSVIIPFKIFLNENAENDYLSLSLVYEIGMKARNINIGDDESEYLKKQEEVVEEEADEATNEQEVETDETSTNETE